MVVGMVGPPGVPIARTGLPPRNTITGESGDAGRLPPATELGTAGALLKSFIAVFRRTPIPGTVKPLPVLVAHRSRQRNDVAMRVDDGDVRCVGRLC